MKNIPRTIIAAASLVCALWETALADTRQNTKKATEAVLAQPNKPTMAFLRDEVLKLANNWMFLYEEWRQTPWKKPLFWPFELWKDTNGKIYLSSPEVDLWDRVLGRNYEVYDAYIKKHPSNLNIREIILRVQIWKFKDEIPLFLIKTPPGSPMLYELHIREKSTPQKQEWLNKKWWSSNEGPLLAQLIHTAEESQQY